MASGSKVSKNSSSSFSFFLFFAEFFFDGLPRMIAVDRGAKHISALEKRFSVLIGENVQYLGLQ